MNTARNKYYILNYVFIICLLILFLNDHYLKFVFANRFTGKLSDMAGIIILPLLIAYLVPRLKPYAVFISALLFTFWKSSFSQAFIDTYNSFAIIRTSRVVDYTDMYVLLLLPLPYLILRKIDAWYFLKINTLHPLLIVVPTVFTLMATSPPPAHYYTRSEGSLKCYKCKTTVNFNQDEIVEKLKKLDIIFDSIAPVDSFVLKGAPALKGQNAHTYRLNNLVIDKDTLRNIEFTMRTIKDRRTRIYFNGMQVSDDISSFKLEKKLRSYYKKILFKELKSELNK